MDCFGSSWPRTVPRPSGFSPPCDLTLHRVCDRLRRPSTHAERRAHIMRIGVPTEIKDNEYRVGMVPSGVRDLTSDGHQILVQAGPGNRTGLSDHEDQAPGAEIVAKP